MKVTWLDNNSWLFEIAGQTVLLDPWLTGDLIFSGQEWLFHGIKQQKYPIPDSIDLILLSQGLEDHAHPPTLKQLDHTLPVIASPNGAKVVQNLGYQQVTSLNHGDTYRFNEKIEITAFPGSLVGATLVENAYVIKDLTNQRTFYYEPHGNHSPELKKIAPIDVVLTPILGQSLLNLVPLLKGQQTTLELCQWLKPQMILPTARAEDTEYEGMLTALLRENGTVDNFRRMLQENQLSTQIIVPKPGETIELIQNGQLISDRQ